MYVKYFDKYYYYAVTVKVSYFMNSTLKPLVGYVVVSSTHACIRIIYSNRLLINFHISKAHQTDIISFTIRTRQENSSIN